MDPLSLTASIVAVLGALSACTKVAQELWGAPNELRKLAADLSELTTLVESLGILTRSLSFHNIGQGALVSAHTKLHDAQREFQERLQQKHEADSPAISFKRRKWLIHRNRIKSLIRDVADIRRELFLVVQSLTLYVDVSRLCRGYVHEPFIKNKLIISEHPH